MIRYMARKIIFWVLKVTNSDWVLEVTLHSDQSFQGTPVLLGNITGTGPVGKIQSHLQYICLLHCASIQN